MRLSLMVTIFFHQLLVQKMFQVWQVYQKCPTGSFNPTTKQCVTGNTAALTDFNNCVSLLQPQQCQGAALPIAVDGAIVYYGYQAGNVNCQLCCPCGVQDCDPTQC